MLNSKFFLDLQVFSSVLFTSAIQILMYICIDKSDLCLSNNYLLVFLYSYFVWYIIIPLIRSFDISSPFYLIELIISFYNVLRINWCIELILMRSLSTKNNIEAFFFAISGLLSNIINLFHYFICFFKIIFLASSYFSSDF